MPLDLNHDYLDSTIITDGERVSGTSTHHTDDGKLTTNMSQTLGLDTEGQPTPIDGYRGGLSTVDAGYTPDNNTMIYYVTDSDSSTFSSKFSPGSTGKPKKIVTFPLGAVAGDMAQVTIFLYQAATFPTKVTSIYTYDDNVSFYLDNGNPDYDYNSAAQNSITQN